MFVFNTARKLHVCDGFFTWQTFLANLLKFVWTKQFFVSKELAMLNQAWNIVLL